MSSGAAPDEPVPTYSEPIGTDDMRLTASVNDSILIRDLEPGARVELRGGAQAEVTRNPQDGGWIYVRIVECEQEPERVGEEELVFCTDVVGAA